MFGDRDDWIDVVKRSPADRWKSTRRTVRKVRIEAVSGTVVYIKNFILKEDFWFSGKTVNQRGSGVWGGTLAKKS